MTNIDSPIRIGAYTLKNRITFAPTVKFDFTNDSGLVTKKHITHYTERAKGGCGLICVEATAVLPGGRFGKTHMGLWDDAHIEGHKAIAEGCHQFGAVTIIQLNHTGYTANPECGLPVGPSAILWKGYRGEYTTVEMSAEEIKEMQQAFIDAAVRAKKAGYDGIQLHGCHSYLINQFMSPVHNQRTDTYGGTTENRARFCTEIIKKVRELCGPDFLISVRTSGYDSNLEDAIAIAEEYVKAGCDYLQVSSGMSSLDGLTPYPDEKISDIQSLGVYFHDHFNGRVPISCVGGIVEPAQARYLIEHDHVDTIDLGRAVLAESNFANAVIHNTPYTKCFSCKACQYGPFTAHTCPGKLKRVKNTIKIQE